MQRFAGRTIVIKYGGSAMVEERLKSGFAEDVVLLRSLGINPVIVHGGGPQIGRVLERLGIESNFVRGLRVTDEATMEIVEMVLAGQINKDIVSMIHSHGGRSVGLSGKDGGLLTASKMRVRVADADGRSSIVDIGLVGKIEHVDPAVVEDLTRNGFIPVIAPIAADRRGRTYNVNADLAAAHIAQALGAAKLILLTDVPGILDAGGRLQPFLSIRQARTQIRKGVIADGMVPKVECAIAALGGGVGQVHIIDGRIPHAILLEIFTRKGVGTEIVRATAAKTAAGEAAGGSSR
ncbi:MAG: acetylglutamate kinase [Candidatus Dadabacteria bacterium]|nr:MAG: acetylglutamate kinase [Candidatus Dadabacteria bacterium]